MNIKCLKKIGVITNGHGRGISQSVGVSKKENIRYNNRENFIEKEARRDWKLTVMVKNNLGKEVNHLFS